MGVTPLLRRSAALAALLTVSAGEARADPTEAIPLTLRPVRTVRAVAGDGPVVIPFSVRNTGAEPLALRATVREVSAGNGDAAHPLAVHAELSVDGKHAESVVVPPRSDGTFAWALTLPTEPGEYGAVVSLADGVHEPAEQSVTITVKRPWRWAVLLVIFGLALRQGLRFLLERVRPRVEVQLRVRRACDDLRDLLRDATDPSEQGAFRALVSEVAALQARAERGKDPGALADEVASVEDRLLLVPAWRAGRAQVRGVRDASLRDPLEDDLDRVEKALLLPGADAAARDDARKLLAALPDRLATAALRQQVSDRVGELRAELAAWGAAPDAPEARALRDAVDALAAAASGDASRENLRSALDAAQRSRALAHAATLRGVVSSALPGVSDDAREALRRKVDELKVSLPAARDGASAWEQFRALYREAMGVLVEGARAELGPRGDAEALSALAGVAERLARDEVEDAGTLYAALQRRWLAAPSRSGGLEGFEAEPPAAPPPVALSVMSTVVKLRSLREVLAVPVTLTPARETATSGALQAARVAVWAAEFVAAGFFAALVVLKDWESNPVWGTGADLGAVVAWTLGASLVAGQTFAQAAGDVGERLRRG